MKAKPRRDYPTTGFFVGQPFQFARRRRAELLKRDIPESVLQAVEYKSAR
jgi:hypothetical protein